MSRSRATQQPPGTYSPEQQHALVAAANRAVTSQLFAAADLMSRVFQVNAVPYAFMGGFALKLRGSIRDTQDVDVAVGCTMQRAIDVLSVQARVRRPAGPTSGVMRIFVLVGGPLDPSVPELWVAVDIILGGSLGAPTDIQNNSEIVTYNTNVGPKQLPIIDIVSAMASKLNAYHFRQERKDYEDIWFLIRTHSEQVFAIRARLDTTHCQYFVASLAERESEEAIRSIKSILNVA